jgi:transcriptional regulator with XRE-family HTH domain
MASVDDLRVVFGRRVRELRTKAKLTQEQLAEKADVHWTYLGGIERGERNPSLVNIGKIANALGVPPADLFAAVRGRTRRG